MDQLFDSVYSGLIWLSDITGHTYREINILVYYFITPFVFIFLLERITKTHYIKVMFAVLAIASLLLIEDFEQFSDKAFDTSVVFLKNFDAVGLNYVQASVVICVFIPILLTLVLWYFGRKKSPTQ